MSGSDRTNALISSLITDVALPEILSIIRRHHEQTGTVPEEAQVREQLAAVTDGIVARGSAYLRQHGIVVPPETAKDTRGDEVGGL